MSKQMPGEDELIRAQQQFSEGLRGILHVMGGRLPSTVMPIYSGDTLWALAQKHLGDGQRWKELYVMNLDVLTKNQDQHGAEQGPNMIFPGTTLRMLLI